MDAKVQLQQFTKNSHSESVNKKKIGKLWCHIKRYQRQKKIRSVVSIVMKIESLHRIEKAERQVWSTKGQKKNKSNNHPDK